MATIGNGAVYGPDLKNVSAVSSAYTVQLSDQFVQVTTGSGNVVVTLPAPTTAGTFNPNTQRPDQSTSGQTGNIGQTVTIQKVDSGAGHVNVLGTLNIGQAYGLNSKWSSATFTSDGTTWNLVGQIS